MDATAEAVDELFRVTYKGITYTFRIAEEVLSASGKLVSGAAHGGAALAVTPSFAYEIMPEIPFASR